MQEQAWTPNTTQVKPADHRVKPLTRKEMAFVQHRVNNPKASGTKSALATYDTDNPIVAAAIASENLRKPHIMAELAKYSDTAEYNLIRLANKSTEYAEQGGHAGAAYASVAERANNSILDRLHGKATQRTESTSRVVTLNVDLTGVTGGPDKKIEK